MMDRLLLGTDPLLATVAASLSEQPGTVEVGTDDEHLAESLHERGIDVTRCDPLDRSALRSFDAPDLVGVFAADAAENREMALAATDLFPDAHLVAYAGEGPALSRRADTEPPLEDVADTVIDPGRAIVDHFSKRIGDDSQRMQQLQRVFRGIANLAIVTHDNPDPDAIASALALGRLARAAGCTTELCYYGEITHQENRAFVNVLNVELRNLTDEDDLSEFDGLALVDHSRPGVNDQLPPDAAVDIVIDHHPPRSPIDARFVDLRSDVGATSTLLVDYLDRFNVSFDEELSTALLFGIHVDTNGFSREVSPRDFSAAATLVPTANFGMLERIESPSISSQTFETIAQAINNRRIEGTVLLSCVGHLGERDALAQAADRLLDLEDINTTLVYGIQDDTIFVSARSRGTDIDLGERLREAFGQIGSAGGHVDMAGAQIRLGVLDAVEDREESLTEIVEAVVASRFLETLRQRPERSIEGVYLTEAELEDEYFVEDASDVSRAYVDRSDEAVENPDEST